MIWTLRWPEIFRPSRGMAAYIHCSLASGAIWRPLVEALRDPAPILIELPGHGAAPDWDQAMDYHDQALSLALSSLPPDPVNIIGHSFGATVALRLAIEAPERVRSLVLIEPVLFAAARAAAHPAYEAHRTAFQPFLEALDRGDKETAAREFTAIWGGGAPRSALPKAQQQYLVDRIHLIPAGAPAIEEDEQDLLAEGRLEALTRPVALIEGELSPAVIPAIHAELARRLPQAERVTINGAGHMLPVSHTRQLADVLRPILA